MTDVRPLHPVEQPPVEDLRNALQIISSTAAMMPTQYSPYFYSVGALIQCALDKLVEPSPAAIRVVRSLLVDCAPPDVRPEELEREARDLAAAILYTQLRGEPLGAPQEPAR